MKKIATLFITSLLCMAAQAQGLGPAHARVNGTPIKKQAVTLGQLQERGLVRKAARKATDEKPITAAPEGRLLDNMYVNSHSFGLGWGSAYTQVVDGGLGGVVEGKDGYVYVKGPISQAYVWSLGTPWVKCKKLAADTIEMITPQIYAIDAGDPYYVQRMTYDKAGDTYVVDSTKSGIKFTWKNDTLRQVDDCLVGFADATGSWFYMGDYGIVYTVNPDKPVSINKDQTQGIDTSLVKVTHIASPEKLDSTTTTMVNAYAVVDIDDEMVGNTIYVDHLEDGLPNALIKINANASTMNLEVPSGQYLGVDENYNSHIYALTGNAYVDSAGTTKYFNYNKTSKLTLNFSAEGDSIFAPYPASLIINCGRNNLYIVKEYVAPLMEEVNDEPMTPANPVFSIDDVTRSTRFDVLKFTIPTVDVDGNDLNTNNLYYCIYYNDAVYTFTPALYTGLKSDMSEIPYGFSDSNYDIFLSGGQHTIYFYDKNWTKLGVQSIYRGGGQERKSAVVWVDSTTGIESVTGAARTVKRVSYYDLQGRQVSSQATGLVIERIDYTDGSNTTSKVVK